MLNRKSLLTLVLTSVVLSPALAIASQTLETTNNKVGVATRYAPSSLTLEQVRIELKQAKAAGLVTYGEQEYPSPIAYTSSKTGEQVQSELRQAKAAGLLTNGEQEYSPEAQADSTKTRAQVRQ